MTNHAPGSDGNGSAWPYASLLLMGFFGANTRAGKRLVWWTTAAFSIVAVAGFTLQEVPIASQVVRVVLAVAMVGGVVGIVWANARYLAELDDLERRIQFEAMAAAYGSVMILAFAWFALHLGQAGAWTADPSYFVLWLLLAEPIRGLVLVRAARRFR